MTRTYWNIVKGIGIILIVIGHVCPSEMGFVYLFHLPLFFFVSGYLYNEEKYGDNPYAHLAARLKSSWMKYVFACWIIILLHNFFVEHKMVWLRGDLYSFADIVSKMSNAAFGETSEDFANALWYVPVAVVATCLLSVIVTLSRKVYSATKQITMKYVVQFVLISACAIIGYYFEYVQFALPAHLQVSLVVMPFLWGGYLLRNSGIDYEKYLNMIVSMVLSILVYIAGCHYELNLATLRVYPYMHVVAFLGIYVCLYLAKVIQKNSLLCNVLDRYGRASFWIMVAHLPLCRLFDWAYINLFQKENFEELYYVFKSVVFVETFWPIYLFVGLGVSLLIFMFYEKLKMSVKKRWNDEKGK